VRILAIIPARLSSTRLPNKPLCIIGDKPMVLHVYDEVVKANIATKVYIATDHESIQSIAKNHGANVMFTDENHENGTERCCEVVNNLEALGQEFDLVINIQGDEPFISQEPLLTLINVFQRNTEADIATLYQNFINEEELLSTNTAKVILNKDNKAQYFSRLPIPFARNGAINLDSYHKHIGIYAYRVKALKEIVQLPVSLWEMQEMLEQLRWLYNGYDVYLAETNYIMISVDTPDDLQKARMHYEQMKTLKSI